MMNYLDDEKVLLLKQLDKIYQKDQLENKRDQKHDLMRILR